MKILILFIVVAIVSVGGYFLLKKPMNNDVSQNPFPSPSSGSPAGMPTITPTPVPTTDKLPDIVKATIVTARGNIELELYSTVAPNTVANFIKLSQAKFYDGTKFHRVIDDFMIQGGDPLSKTDDPKVGTGGPGYRFADEINPRVLGVSEATIKQAEAKGYVYNYELKSMKVEVGVIAMANAGPNTNGSQFFIVTTKAQPHLNGLHTVFGKVTKGLDIARAIKQGDVVKTIEIK